MLEDRIQLEDRVSKLLKRAFSRLQKFQKIKLNGKIIV